MTVKDEELMLAGIIAWKREKRRPARKAPLAAKPEIARTRESFGLGGMNGLRAWRKYMRMCRDCGADLRVDEGAQCAKCSKRRNRRKHSS